MARKQQAVRVLSEVGHCQHEASSKLAPIFEKYSKLWIGVCSKCRKPISLTPTTVWPELPERRKQAKPSV